jgi:hypothetical protein
VNPDPDPYGFEIICLSVAGSENNIGAGSGSVFGSGAKIVVKKNICPFY